MSSASTKPQELLQASFENFFVSRITALKRRGMAFGAVGEPVVAEHQFVTPGQNGFFPRAVLAGEGEGVGRDWHCRRPVTSG